MLPALQVTTACSNEFACFTHSRMHSTLTCCSYFCHRSDASDTFPFLDLPDPCLLAVLRCSADDLRSLFTLLVPTADCTRQQYWQQAALGLLYLRRSRQTV